MKRLTKIYPSGSYGIVGDIDDVVHRLAAIEDIMGEECELDELREMVQAKQEGRCVVFVSGYPVVSIYGKAEDGLCTREVSGVITEEEYKAALRREQDG